MRATWLVSLKYPLLRWVVVVYGGLGRGRDGSGLRLGVMARERDRRSRPVFQSRAYYDRKRAEGKRHNQALIALARRRCDTLYGMLRDGTYYERPQPSAA